MQRAFGIFQIGIRKTIDFEDNDQHAGEVIGPSRFICSKEEENSFFVIRRIVKKKELEI
jgi:hypothetical protein